MPLVVWDALMDEKLPPDVSDQPDDSLYSQRLSPAVVMAKTSSGPAAETLTIVPGPESSCKKPLAAMNDGLYSHIEWSASTP